MQHRKTTHYPDNQPLAMRYQGVPNLHKIVEILRDHFNYILLCKFSPKQHSTRDRLYMKQLKKGDVVEIWMTDMMPGHTGTVKSNNGEKVKITSGCFCVKKPYGCRSFDVKTGLSSGPGLISGGEAYFFYIVTPDEFFPDTFMKVVDLKSEDITILCEKPKNNSMSYDDVSF